MELKTKNYAVVTGSSKGIGEAIARELAKRNINLLLVARSGDLLKKISDEIQKTFSVDVKILALDLSEHGAAIKVFDFILFEVAFSY